ncbi:major royal jelly family protein [Asaia krungthepensis]|uniref:Gluconolactonase n=1 Tax=Asaia krungthepensis NRIC 0535 TaxID=1307925 RepID=A0ABQ0Q5P6_9PROT|nr:major royal jelly family protein [Asaia krungthepensis]GBQ92613.1 gluconolactonase [Asaia krungthepensis NRIC 0535]
MLNFCVLSRKASPRLIPFLATLVASSLPLAARAAHERPYVADTAQARVIQTIDLPGQATWKQALPVRDGSVFLLRNEGRGETTTPYLLRLPAGSAIPGPFQPDWSGRPDAAQHAARFHPVAMATNSDGSLWLVDQGASGDTPHLLRLDAATGAVIASHELPPEALSAQSRFASLAVHGETAYLADEGGIALVAFDWHRHAATRFFAGYPTSRGHVPLTIDHKVVQAADNRPLTRDIAYLALETDGAWLYEMAPTGPIYRLSSALLTDTTVTPAELMEGVTQWRGIPTIGGITIDNRATLYMTDISEGRLLSFDTGRHPHILLSMPALVQAAMPGWKASTAPGSASGEIYIPVSHQLLRIALP